MNKSKIENGQPEQMLNSIPKVDAHSSVSHIGNNMLGAGACSSDSLSIEKALELSAPIDCPANEYAKGSLIPLKCADSDNEIIDVIICTSMSGGANYENGMPKELTLNRKDYLNGKFYEANYVLQSSFDDA